MNCMSNNTLENNFMIGEPVVYPQQGVGIVKEITQRKFNGEELSYYKIYLSNSDMTVLIPVTKAIELGIRHIVSKEEADNAIKKISSKGESSSSDWKVRYQNNQDLLKDGSILSIAKVVQTLYHRSKVKELPVQERKLYDSALLLLIDEVSYALDKSKEEVQTLILSKLEK